MGDLVYKDLSFKLVGLAYEVHNSLGSGLKEVVYQNAYEVLLKKEDIPYKRELYYPCKIRGEIVHKNFFDFLVEDKIIVEFKVGGDKFLDAFNQLRDYLKTSKLKLGLIMCFTSNGVKVKRILNLY